jgi:hypothetical protein
MNKFKLIDISIKNFRGFNKEVVFNFEGNYNSILISGNNGIGKTSFYDAIEWAFTGKLFRYSDESEEKKCKFINFQPVEEGEYARVALTLGNQEISFTVIRELVKFENVVSDFGEKNTKLTIIKDNGCFIYGEEACKFMSEMLISEEWKNKLEFSDVFSQYHLLTQDKMKYFIQGIKMPERYHQIANLLGNDRYLKYNDGVAKIRKDIQKENLELEKKINEVESIIKGLESTGINSKEMNIEEFNDMYRIISELTKKLDEYKTIYNINYDFNIDTYNVDEINRVMNNVVLMKDALTQNREARKVKEQELSILKTDFNDYLISIKNQETYNKSRVLYNRLGKISFLRENLKSYESYKNEVDDFSKKNQKTQQDIETGKLTLDFVREIYLDLKQKINYINNLNIKTNIESVDLSELQSFLLESKIVSENDRFVIYFKSGTPEILNKNFIEKEVIDSSYLKFNQVYTAMNQKLKNSIDRSINDLNRISTENYNYKNELIELEKELNNLSDLEIGIKEILMLARKHIEKDDDDKMENTNCPVCGTPFSYFHLLNVIDEKLSMSNECVKKKQLDIECIKRIIKENSNLSKEIQKGIHNYLQGYINTIMTIYKRFEDIGILIKKNNEDLATQKEQFNLKLQDVNKNNSKYIDLLDELKIKSENLDEYLQKTFNELNAELSKLAHSYEKYELDEMDKLIYNTGTKIELYKHRLSNNNIDINNIELSIMNKIEIENMAIESIGSAQSNLELIKSKLYDICDIVRNNNRYTVWKENKLKLSKYKQDDLRAKKLIENLNKLELAISNTVLKLNQDIMLENEEFINSIFKRIFTHPYYRKLKFEFGENNYGNKTLKMICYHENGKTLINPTYIFSSTQVNILALSVFLSIAIRQKCTNLDLILLDDPIQNMDDMNILSFIDVLRSCIDQNILDKQLVISTHDNKINNLFIKKFRFYKSKIYKFVDYTFEGPRILCKELK